jgi:hypothetical protein
MCILACARGKKGCFVGSFFRTKKYARYFTRGQKTRDNPWLSVRITSMLMVILHRFVRESAKREACNKGGAQEMRRGVRSVLEQKSLDLTGATTLPPPTAPQNTTSSRTAARMMPLLASSREAWAILYNNRILWASRTCTNSGVIEIHSVVQTSDACKGCARTAPNWIARTDKTEKGFAYGGRRKPRWGRIF